MYIYWLGESSYKIKTSNDTIIVIDPAHKKTGLAQTSLQANIVLTTNTMHTDIKRVSKTQNGKKPFVIKVPGEYETNDVLIYGQANQQQQTLYLIQADNIQIAHLAGLNKELSDKQLELFEGVDILMLPVGNHGVLSPGQADSVVSQVEPKIVIPMNYKLPKLAIEREPVQNFLSEMGAENIKPETSLYITEKKLPQKETVVFLLQP